MPSVSHKQLRWARAKLKIAQAGGPLPDGMTLEQLQDFASHFEPSASKLRERVTQKEDDASLQRGIKTGVFD